MENASDSTSGTDGLDEGQLIRLLDVGRSLVSELDLEAVLTHVLDAARDLTQARYAALGVLDSDKRELERFLFVGIDEQTRAEIGPLPRGHGILGELIRNPEPLRLRRISDHPRSYGFPSGHPEMTTFAGVPVTVRGEIYGNLYLTEKAGGAEFDERDERLLIVLAEWAAIAIENARMYEVAERGRVELERAARGLQATASLSRELSGETDMDRVVELIVKRGRALIDARTLVFVTPSGDEYRVAGSAGELADAVGRRSYAVVGSPIDDAVRSGVAIRLHGDEMRWFTGAGIDARAALLVPMRQGRMNEGVLIALDPFDGEQFSHDDELVLGSFAASAAAAIATGRALESDRMQLSIGASERERRRWARELHDETMQELGALKVMQESALQMDDPTRLRRALTNASEQVGRVINNLEALITELRPASLDQLGSQAAIEALVEQISERSALAIETDFDLAYESGRVAKRHDPDLESAIYRIVQEALNNAVKHAGAEHVRIAVVEDETKLRVTVEDDGGGFSQSEGDRQGFGLIGMRERVEQLDGELAIGEGQSGGARVTATFPVRGRNGEDPSNAPSDRARGHRQ
jgi:signal transduction histidine kinase